LSVHGHAWHYSCWMDAGAPDETESESCGVSESGSTEHSGCVTVPESATNATKQSAGGDTPAESTRRGTASHSHPARSGRFERDPAEELHDWSRETRSIVPDASDEQS